MDKKKFKYAANLCQTADNQYNIVQHVEPKLFNDKTHTESFEELIYATC